jgi:hypothetical protein
MKYQKLLIIAASVCLSVAFLSGPAQAQTLDDIVDDYCAALAVTVADTNDELFDAYQQGAECIIEAQDCTADLGPRDSAARCLSDFSQCTKRVKAQTACTDFVREWQAETKIAERSAKRNGVLVEFNLWVQGEGSVSPTSTECFFEAYQLAEDCFEN